jgi:hypothetical protein
VVRSLYKNPDSKEMLGKKSRDWINRYHSKRETINKQLAQFEIMIQDKLTRSENDL